MDKTQHYLKAHSKRFLEELFELLRIPSISADSKFKGEVRKAAEWVRAHLQKIGADEVQLFETPGHPIVFAQKMIDPNLPTVLVYGHYDVQPPDPLDLWESGPFDPVIKKTEEHPQGAIFARGACDDKGQFFMHLKSFEALMASDELPLNIKFLIEGEEEIGSDHLESFCREHRDLLATDTVLISDTSMLSNVHPSITTGLRGLSYLEVEVTGPNKDLHSGVYGGAVANPINILSQMIASLQDENNRITIPGFYNDVAAVSDEERMQMNKAPFDLEEYQNLLDIQSIHGEAGYTTLERTTIRPTLDVNGIWGGYIGEGAKTVLPSKAYAKISMRLVPYQNPEKITELFTDHFNSIAPPSVKVKVTPHHGGHPVVTPIDTPEYQAAQDAMETTFGKKPLPLRSGGSIPIVALFENVLGVKTVLLGFGLDTDAIHSPNEHYGLFNFYKGIETIPHFLDNYAKQKKL
jgi:acetylornithine deacetylase/succinyl-diaminopimelate desuccinylase-like protein